MNTSIERYANEFRGNLENILVKTAKLIARDKQTTEAISTSKAIQAKLQKERSELVTALFRAMSEAGLGGEMRQMLLQKIRTNLGEIARERPRSQAIAIAVLGLMAGIMLNAPVDAVCEHQPRVCHHLRLASWPEDR